MTPPPDDTSPPPHKANRLVGYAASADLIRCADKLPSNLGRARLVHALIHAYGLLKGPEDPLSDEESTAVQNCKIIPVLPLPRDQLAQFHDKTFLKYVLGLDKLGEEAAEDALEEQEDLDSDGEETTVKNSEKYGLEFDCPYFLGLATYIRLVAGASVACADFLLGHASTTVPGAAGPTAAPVAINWTGGRHHAKKARCAGFCYINDAVLCIQRLRTRFPRVLYLDLDLHHGDGVEAAFARSPKVATLSVHRFAPGFYPGTGALADEGRGPGTGYTLNIPTRRGLTAPALARIWREIVEPYKTWFQPDAVVFVAGADGLARDVHREWNLAIPDLAAAVQSVLKWNLPTVLLGGGGYHHADTARCWTYLTATALGRAEEAVRWDDIPEHAMLDAYADDAYRFHIDANAGKMGDENNDEYIDGLVDTVAARIRKYVH